MSESFKPHFVLPQVNGHLDYMRQMDTILVAAGVPTKEVAGASFALRQPVTATEGAGEILPRVPGEQQVTQKHSQAEDGGVSCSEGAGEATDAAGDGWDIPDISDLLDSLSDAEPASHAEVGNITEEGAPGERSAQNGLPDNAGDDDKPAAELG